MPVREWDALAEIVHKKRETRIVADRGTCFRDGVLGRVDSDEAGPGRYLTCQTLQMLTATAADVEYGRRGRSVQQRQHVIMDRRCLRRASHELGVYPSMIQDGRPVHGRFTMIRSLMFPRHVNAREAATADE